MKHCVQYSTGIGSAEVARRVEALAEPEDELILLTADTMVEDDDNWRFAEEVVAKLLSPRWQWVVLRDGRTPMQVGRDKKVVPNNRLAVCSKVLKSEILNRWIKHNCDPDNTVIHLGFDWTEPHRFERSLPHWKPYTIDAVLMREPYREKSALMQEFRELGVEPPRLYSVGFSHANCGGACVRGGQASWKLLYEWNPERFGEWEEEEERTRVMLGKDVAMMRETVKGEMRPLTLRRFRERIEEQPKLFDAEDWGTCGCFMDTEGEETQ
jgi:hypothetical protein